MSSSKHCVASRTSNPFSIEALIGKDDSDHVVKTSPTTDTEMEQPEVEKDGSSHRDESELTSPDPQPSQRQNQDDDDGWLLVVKLHYTPRSYNIISRPTFRKNCLSIYK